MITSSAIRPPAAGTAYARTPAGRTPTKFRYEEIANELEGRIEAGTYRSGECLPAEPALAASFGVNRVTLRRALGLLASKGLFVRQQGRGTFVAVPDKQPRRLLYVGEMGGHVYRDLYMALTALAPAENLVVQGLDASLRQEPSAWLEQASGRLASTDVLVLDSELYPRIAERLDGAGSQTLCVVGHHLPESRRAGFYLLFNPGRAIEQAMGHLVSLGHRRVALATMAVTEEVAPGRDVPPNAAMYLGGYEAARAHHRLSYARVIPLQGDNTEEDVGRAVTLLQEVADRPTAVVCSSDFRARSVYAAAARLSLRIPGQLSVMGVWDTPWARAFDPELTSVNCGERDMAEMIVRLCGGVPPNRDVVIRMEPSLILRKSCAAAMPGLRGEPKTEAVS